MPSKTKYSSLLKDDSFTDLDVCKVRRLAGLALAECLGTAFFVFLGCGNVVGHISGSDTTHLNTAIAFAFGIGASIACFGHISGAIMNPALNFALLVLGHFSIFKLVFYTVFQVLGAILGILMVQLVTPDMPENFCVVSPNPDVGLGRAAAVEFIITAILTAGLCAVADPRKAPYADNNYLKFAVVILAIAIPSAKYTGCAMNPARAFAPALLSSNWSHHWIYWVIPILSSSVMAFIYRAFFDASLYEDSARRNSIQMT